MNKELMEKLVKEALKAREEAYSPYSKFSVGAALLTKEGKIYKGCNIESASYSPTVCAERTAFFKAVSEGEKDFAAIAVVGGKKGEKIKELSPPCGVCCQVMSEFCDPYEFKILLADDPSNIKVFSLKELLPFGFSSSLFV